MKKITILLLLVAVSSLFASDFTIGGALRYSYFLKSWDEADQNKGGTFAFDTFRLNVSGEKGGIGLNAEYRFYVDSNIGNYSFLKSGYFSYTLPNQTDLELGVTQVPFGILPYATNNFFFGLPYYVGLEDDYDAGLKLSHQLGSINLQAAFFKNMEVPGANNQRYSLDLVNNYDGADAAMANEEINQFNLRAAYSNDLLELGGSLQYGGIYNSVTEEMGSHVAWAGHLIANWNNLNLKAQYSAYNYDPENGGADASVVYMGSYAWPYQVAAEANLLSAAISYKVPVKLGPISAFTFYNDYSLMQKAEASFADSKMNTTGCMISAGAVYIYLDYIMGQNQPWIGGNWNNSLAAGTEDVDWENRLNINLGYYF
ncbi:MAG: hypothetical protein R6U84_00575 [Candidatus Cloacimonadales bacterium]